MIQNIDNITLALDNKNFEILFKTNFKELSYFAFRYIKDLETSKEIVQDAFIGLWEKRDSIDLSKQVKSYLYTTIRNKCLNHIRDNKKFNDNIIDINNIDIDFEEGDKLIEEELNFKINNAISELPPKCREIFNLNRFDNLKYQEIADKLEISIKTVEAQMSKALQHMRIKLVDYISILLIIIHLIYYS